MLSYFITLSNKKVKCERVDLVEPTFQNLVGHYGINSRRPPSSAITREIREMVVLLVHKEIIMSCI